MNRDDVIRMAREAGMERVIDIHKDGTRTIELPHPDLLERFAALVASAEREECAAACEEFYSIEFIAQECAAAIRARSNQ